MIKNKKLLKQISVTEDHICYGMFAVTSCWVYMVEYNWVAGRQGGHGFLLPVSERQHESKMGQNNYPICK